MCVRLQIEFSLCRRHPDTSGLLAACRELGVTPLAYSPIAQGRLTGKYDANNKPKVRVWNVCCADCLAEVVRVWHVLHRLLLQLLQPKGRDRLCTEQYAWHTLLSPHCCVSLAVTALGDLLCRWASWKIDNGGSCCHGVHLFYVASSMQEFDRIVEHPETDAHCVRVQGDSAMSLGRFCSHSSMQCARLARRMAARHQFRFGPMSGLPVISH